MSVIRELLQNSIAMEKVKRYSAVNIGYTDQTGLEQETQLNVFHRLDTEEGKRSWRNYLDLFAKSLRLRRTV